MSKRLSKLRKRLKRIATVVNVIGAVPVVGAVVKTIANPIIAKKQAKLALKEATSIQREKSRQLTEIEQAKARLTPLIRKPLNPIATTVVDNQVPWIHPIQYTYVVGNLESLHAPVDISKLSPKAVEHASTLYKNDIANFLAKNQEGLGAYTQLAIAAEIGAQEVEMAGKQKDIIRKQAHRATRVGMFDVVSLVSSFVPGAGQVVSIATDGMKLAYMQSTGRKLAKEEIRASRQALAGLQILLQQGVIKQEDQNRFNEWYNKVISEPIISPRLTQAEMKIIYDIPFQVETLQKVQPPKPPDKEDLQNLAAQVQASNLTPEEKDILLTNLGNTIKQLDIQKLLALKDKVNKSNLSPESKQELLAKLDAAISQVQRTPAKTAAVMKAGLGPMLPFGATMFGLFVLSQLLPKKKE